MKKNKLRKQMSIQDVSAAKGSANLSSSLRQIKGGIIIEEILG